MMRIGLVASEYTRKNNGGGIGTYVRTLAHEFARQGHTVHIIAEAPHGERVTREGEVLVHHVALAPFIPRPVWGRWGTTSPFMIERARNVRRKVAELCRHGGLDVVEAAEWGAESLLLNPACSPPVVVRFHGPRFLVGRMNRLRRMGPQTAVNHRLTDVLERRAILRAARTSSPARAMAKLISDHYGRPDLYAATNVIPNPLDTTWFSPTPGGKAERAADEQTVTFVGRLEQRKGVHVLAEAACHLVKKYPRLRMQFIGNDSGSAPDGGSMKRYIMEHFAPARELFHFLGPLPPSDLPRYYRQSALVVVPSLYENFPYTCAEAMSCGKAVVASNTGGLAEMIVDHETGRLVPPADAPALAAALGELLDDPAQRERLGRNARDFAVARLQPAQIAGEMLRLYEEATW